MRPNETKTPYESGQTLKNWWIQQGSFNNQEALKNKIRQVCGWNRDLWYNKIEGRTEISHLEQMAINKITKAPVFEIQNLLND